MSNLERKAIKGKKYIMRAALLCVLIIFLYTSFLGSVRTVYAADDNSATTNLVDGKDITPDTVMSCMHPGLASAFKTIKPIKWMEISGTVTSLSNVVNMLSPSTLSDNDKDLLCVVLVQACEEKNMFKGDAKIVATVYKRVSLTRLQESTRSSYSSSVYSKLSSVSKQFSSTYGNAKPAEPNQIIFYNQSIKLKNPLINYNGCLMASISDLYQFIDSECYSNEGTATLSITGKVRVEYIPGKNIAYVDDRSAVMDVAMLYINKEYYIPVNFFAQAHNMGYSYCTDERVIILYDNVNQLSIPTSANVLVTSNTFSSNQ